MRRYLHPVAVLAAVGLLAGCNLPPAGTSMSLGNVPYDQAFQAAREVLAQNFSVASADPAGGVIESRPASIPGKPTGLLHSNPPARQIATLKLRRQGDQVVACLAVEVQRQGSTAIRELQAASGGYDTVPNRTPAEIDAATTAEQNEAWQTQSYDHMLENAVLRQLYRRLHGSPQGKTDPAP